MSRVICVLIGYLFGNFLTAAIVSISFGYGLLACIVGLIGVLISHYLPVGATVHSGLRLNKINEERVRK